MRWIDQFFFKFWWQIQVYTTDFTAAADLAGLRKTTGSNAQALNLFNTLNGLS